MPKNLPTKRQQGKAYTKEQREKIIQTLKPYLQLGYDLHNACILAEQPYTTVINWVKKDDQLCNQVKAWQNMVNAKARQNVVKQINEGDTQESKWWLERREKKEFSTRTEQTGEDGKDLFPPLDDTQKKELAKLWS